MSKQLVPRQRFQRSKGRLQMRKFVLLVAVIVVVYSMGYSEQSVPMPEMVVIPAGSFLMGCGEGKDCQGSEKPSHEVQVDTFALSKYEVTFEQYDAFADATGRERPNDEGWGRGNRPVLNVYWEDAVAYAKWLSEQTGENYRLPSEAEWEYAARAGTVTRYSWGDSIGVNRANCYECGSEWDNKQTAPMGSFPPNAWGVHDMHGNVWEWVQDTWNRNYEGAPTDGSAWENEKEEKRVLRGGSWRSWSGNLQYSRRRAEDSTDTRNDIHRGLVTKYRSAIVGFRVAR